MQVSYGIRGSAPDTHHPNTFMSHTTSAEVTTDCDLDIHEGHLHFVPNQGVGNPYPLLAKGIGEVQSDLESVFEFTPAKAAAAIAELKNTGQVNVDLGDKHSCYCVLNDDGEAQKVTSRCAVRYARLALPHASQITDKG